MAESGGEEEKDQRDRERSQVMARRREVLSALEHQRGTKAITLIHRREPWADDDQYITVEDSEYVLMQIKHTPKEQPIDLILHTPGGLALAAEMIGIAVKHHPAKVTVMVPFYAMSGGTLIALGADEILMERYSILGPVDPQIMGIPAAALLRVFSHKPLAAISDDIIVKAEVARLAVENIKAFVRWLLEGRMPPSKAAELADFLTGGYLAHDTPLTLEVAAALGLNVREGIPPQVDDLFSTCEFGTCKRPCMARYEEAGVGQGASPSTLRHPLR